jgi:hypothetical protein
MRQERASLLSQRAVDVTREHPTGMKQGFKHSGQCREKPAGSHLHSRNNMWCGRRKEPNESGALQPAHHIFRLTTYWKWRTSEELAKWAEQTGMEDVVPCMPFGKGRVQL